MSRAYDVLAPYALRRDTEQENYFADITICGERLDEDDERRRPPAGRWALSPLKGPDRDAVRERLIRALKEQHEFGDPDDIQAP